MAYSLYRVKNIKSTKLNEMSSNELIEYIQSGQKYANKRRDTVKRAILKGQISVPNAYRHFKPSKKSAEPMSYMDITFGGSEDINELKKMSRGELLHNAVEIRSFLNAKTSTVYGWRNYNKEMAERIAGYAAKAGLDWTEKIKAKPLWKPQSKKFWEVYEKFGEREGYNFGEGGSNQAVLMVYQAVFLRSDLSVLSEDELVEILVNQAEDYYEALEERRNMYDDNGEFYNI